MKEAEVNFCKRCGREIKNGEEFCDICEKEIQINNLKRGYKNAN